MKIAYVACTVAAVLAAAAVHAQSITMILADGYPWTVDGPRGGTIQLTLKPDGTGRAGSGLLARRFTWTSNRDVLCLEGLPGAAAGCMTLSTTEGGFVGVREDGRRVRFTR